MTQVRIEEMRKPSLRWMAFVLATLVFAMALTSAPASAGDGRFGVGGELGITPSSVAVGDFNSDGRPNIATVNRTDAQVRVRLGAAGGGFTRGANVDAGNDPRLVVVADFDADGDDDLAVTDFQDRDVSVRLGKGNGAFTNAADIDLTRHPYSLVVGDFNGDHGRTWRSRTWTPRGSGWQCASASGTARSSAAAS